MRPTPRHSADLSRSELAETLRRNSDLSAEASTALVDRLFAVLGRPTSVEPAKIGEDLPTR